MNKFFRHGDLAFKKIDKLPTKLNKIDYNGVYSLQEGETTGHHHRLVADKQDIELFKDEQGNYFFAVKGHAKMTHPEHKDIVLAPGLYEMNHEKEKDWFSLEVRQVID